MCGISGVFKLRRGFQSAELLRACGILSHRGPDGTRTWSDDCNLVGLGHNRLAIIDVECGHQPMATFDGRLVIVFNGEIYNFRELRQQLESRHHLFRTHSDTEVLLAAFREWGSDCLLKLEGMFAFAIYDRESQELFLARDRTGIKPLYYCATPEGLFFGSELKSVLTWKEVPRNVNPFPISDFLRLTYTIPPETCFRDCKELLPGNFLVYSRDGSRETQYWSWHCEEASWSAEDSLQELDSQLNASVGQHLVSDVPVGAFLSGGIDSSLLVAMMAKVSDEPVRTFTVKFGEDAYDESTVARSVALHLKTEHHEICLPKGGYDFNLVNRVLDQFDQPFGDSSAIPSYLISEKIREHVKVVIGGDGGDEMFGGYPRFMHADAVRFLGSAPRWILNLTEKLLGSAATVGVEHRRQANRLVSAAKAQRGDRLTALCSIISRQELAEITTPDFSSAISSRKSIFRNSPYTCEGGRDLIDVTVMSSLPGDYLRKIDVMSSAHGLEVRVPFLSNQILEFSQKLPHRLKYSWTQNKLLLRKLAARYLPKEVTTRRKQGFGIPLDSWLGEKGRTELYSTLVSERSLLKDYIRPAYVKKLLDGFVSGNWDRSRVSRFGMYQRVYSLWALERWLNRWQPSA